MAHTPMFRLLVRALQQARRENLAQAGLPAPVDRGALRRTRRGFLKTTVAAALAASGCGPLPVTTGTSTGRPSVVVLGAGLAGLNAALKLKRAGFEPAIYEASDRLGGRVFSRIGAVAEGLISEMGAEFINSDHDDMLQLVKEFGLTLYDRKQNVLNSANPDVAYLFGGKLRKEADIANGLRPLAAQISADADLLDRDYDRYSAELDRLSVRQYLDQHAGLIKQTYIRTLIENTIRTEFGVEPDQSSALQLIYNLPTVAGKKVDLLGGSDELYVVSEGNSKIIDGFAKVLSQHVQTYMRVAKITQLAEQQYEVTFTNNQAVRAQHVVVALPFTALRDVTLDVPIADGLKQFIAEAELGSNEKLHAGFKQKVWRNTGGFNSEIWVDQVYSEAWDASQRQTQRTDGALTYYFGGAQTQALLESGADLKAFGRTCNGLLANVFASFDEATTANFSRSGWSNNRWIKGAYTNFKPGQYTRFADYFWVEGEPPSDGQSVRAGNVWFVGEHVSDEFYGFMNGAAQTGRLAAQAIIAQYRSQKVKTA